MNWLSHFPDGTTEHRATLANGLSMRWFERGEGPVVLCLHGFPEISVSWKHQLAGLSDSARVVAPDMRGYGGTDAPLPVRAYTLAHLCDDIDGLIEALGVQDVHLVGHDWGGAVTWEFAARFPHRVRTVTVLNCPAMSVMAKAVFTVPAQARKSWYIAFFQLPWVPEYLSRRDPEATIMRALMAGAVNRGAFNRELAAPYIEQVRERGLHGGINYYRANGKMLGFEKKPVHAPSQLIWGVGDPFLGPWFMEVERWKGVVDNLVVHPIHESGHWVQQEQPEQVNDLLRRWLQDHGIS